MRNDLPTKFLLPHLIIIEEEVFTLKLYFFQQCRKQGQTIKCPICNEYVYIKKLEMIKFVILSPKRSFKSEKDI